MKVQDNNQPQGNAGTDRCAANPGSDRFAPFAAKLAQAGLPDLLQCSFQPAYRRLLDGATGHISEEEIAHFQDITRDRYFNTNNIWLHLPSLQALFETYDGLLPLPVIRNEKSVDPTEPNSPAVYQLESAMGQAIGLFPRAEALQTPRKRFLPVKDTNDLLAIASDLFVLDHDYSLHPNPARTIADAPTIDLDENYFGLIDQFQARFAGGWPSLLDCRHLSVEGDFYFDGDLVLSGHVVLQHEGTRPIRLATQIA